jgi:hypothetical protein
MDKTNYATFRVVPKFAPNEMEDAEVWSNDFIVNRFKQELATTDLTSITSKTDILSDDRIFDSRKYYNQAYHYLKIGALNPVPRFFISLSDLSPKLVKELAELDKEERNYILKQAVALIFQEINNQLYHFSISSVLRVQLVE